MNLFSEKNLISGKNVPYYPRLTGQLSSVVEQRFCKPSVGGSNPSAGSIFVYGFSLSDASRILFLLSHLQDFHLRCIDIRETSMYFRRNHDRKKKILSEDSFGALCRCAGGMSDRRRHFRRIDKVTEQCRKRSQSPETRAWSADGTSGS